MNLPLIERLLRATIKPGEYPMTDDLVRYEARLKQARSYLLEYPTSTCAVLMLELYGKDESYSRSTAYRDIADAKTFFGQIDRVDKEFERIISIEKLQDSRKRAALLAKSTNDYYKVACIDEMIGKLKGLDKQETGFDISKLQPPPVHILINAGDLVLDGLTGKQFKQQTIDLIEGESFSVEQMGEQLEIMEKVNNPTTDE